MISNFKETREKRGISLTEAAECLKIQKKYLQAIEDKDYSQLPGGVYSVGFLKSYANFLKLDAGKAVKDFEQWLLNPQEESFRAQIEKNLDLDTNSNDSEEQISKTESYKLSDTEKLIVITSIVALILFVCAFI